MHHGNIGQMVVWLIVVGVVMWAINTYVPMQEGIKRVMNILVVVAVVYWILQTLGVLAYLGVNI